jgi:hypothetical protein
MAVGVTVLLGTGKGAFLLEGEGGRDGWSLRGPFCDGWPVSHVIAEPGSGRLWAAAGDEWHGSGVWRSDDGGATWRLARLATGQFDDWLARDPEMAAYTGMEPAPPAPFTGRLDALWSLCRAGGRLYAGGKPGLLFVSEDDGDSWQEVEALRDHPSRESWQPGGAGLVLHSIVAGPGSPPARLWVGISAAGVLASEDGGASWERRNRRSNTGAAEDGEVGHCVHSFVRATAAEGDLLYQQNHHGVFRSPDGGRSWEEITEGLPSGFGFPIAVHPDDPRTVWVLPLNGDMEGRYPPGAAAAVWRTRDGGASWEAMRDGLPGRDCYFTVLRQAMATDRAAPAGVYFGTSTGSVFASDDEGAHWTEIARHLPPIRSVETLTTA